MIVSHESYVQYTQSGIEVAMIWYYPSGQVLLKQLGMMK